MKIEIGVTQNLSPIKGTVPPPPPPKLDMNKLKAVQETVQNKPVPNAPIFSNNKMKKARDEAKRKAKLPEPPTLSPEKLKEVSNKIHKEHEDQKSVR